MLFAVTSAFIIVIRHIRAFSTTRHGFHVAFMCTCCQGFTLQARSRRSHCGAFKVRSSTVSLHSSSPTRCAEQKKMKSCQVKRKLITFLNLEPKKHAGIKLVMARTWKDGRIRSRNRRVPIIKVGSWLVPGCVFHSYGSCIAPRAAGRERCGKPHPPV